MNILHMKYAVEVAKTGSINSASKVLFVTQPNLSRAIKSLESSLGITIFERSSRGMTLTAEGEEFIEYAKRILGEIDEVENFYSSNSFRKQQFSISVPRASYIAHAFVQFTKGITANPAEFFYEETNAMKAVSNILDNDYRLGIVRYAQQYDRYFRDFFRQRELNFETVTSFRYHLIMSRNSHLAGLKEIHFTDLEDYIEIAHADLFVPSLSEDRVKKEELSEDIGRRVFVFERASQFDMLSENEQTFMWVSPVPDKYLDIYGLSQRECIDNTKIYKDVLIYRKDYSLTELDKAFITELTKSRRTYL